MADRPKPDLEPEEMTDVPASPPPDPSRRERSPEARSTPAVFDELGAQAAQEMAAKASEELLTPRGLPSETSPPPDAIILTGFLGGSGRGGYRRLYMDVTLKDYVEIADRDVRHLEWVGTEQSLFGRKATLWIARDAQLDYTTRRR